MVRSTRPPTLAGALALLRDDDHARLIAVLAVTFAWSFGFVVGFLLGENANTSGTDEPSR